MFTTAAMEFKSGQDDDGTALEFGSDVREEENRVSWSRNPDTRREFEYIQRDVSPGGPVDYVLADGSHLRVRALDPYDGLNLGSAGVPQPLEVLRADILRGGGMVAQELSAVVAPDNTVATLMLETGLGVYVRFSGDWQLLSPTSTALEDMQILPVSPEALAVFDAADMANSTLSAFDLPRQETAANGAKVDVLPEPAGLSTQLTASAGGVIVASGLTIPIVSSADDLDMAIKYGDTHPAARWYIAKRAVALGVPERVPADWAPQVVVHPF